MVNSVLGSAARDLTWTSATCAGLTIAASVVESGVGDVEVVTSIIVAGCVLEVEGVRVGVGGGVGVGVGVGVVVVVACLEAMSAQLRGPSCCFGFCWV